MDENKFFDRNSETEYLPQARVGQRYSLIGVDFLPTNSSAYCWFDGLKETGLHFFPDKKQIIGIPLKSGQFDVNFNVRQYNEAGEEMFSSRTLKLIVEDDYDFQIEKVEENDPYWKPDEKIEIVPVNRDSRKRLKKDVVAVNRRGQQHVMEGKICEDDFRVHYNPNTRWYVLAVADGSGKAKYSHQGSKIACNAAVESCSERLTGQSRELKRLAIKYIRSRSVAIHSQIMQQLHNIIAASIIDASVKVANEAITYQRHPKEYATGLFMCICKKFEFGWLIGTFGTGDGAVCIYRSNSNSADIHVLAREENLSEISFLTTPDITQPAELERRINFTIVDDFTALFLMTGGICNPKFEEGTRLSSPEYWKNFWNELNVHVNFSGEIKNTGEQLLKWIDFRTSGKYDDRTLAIMF